MVEHRDLVKKELIDPVLYCFRDNRWKLTDFGISAEATSRRARTTLHSKGSSSYRAPELLAERGEFTNKVDIWALGCILHELATGRLAFHQDWAVREYSVSESPLPISLPSLPAFLEHHISESIHDLLIRNWEERPSAQTVRMMFLTYSQLLNLSIREKLINADFFPSFQEWKSLMQTQFDEHEFWSKLAEIYKQKGEPNVAAVIRQTFVHDEGEKKYDLETRSRDVFQVRLLQRGYIHL
jgi:serine/threonine protein kinase